MGTGTLSQGVIHLIAPGLWSMDFCPIIIFPPEVVQFSIVANCAISKTSMALHSPAEGLSDSHVAILLLLLSRFSCV